MLLKKLISLIEHVCKVLRKTVPDFYKCATLISFTIKLIFCLLLSEHLEPGTVVFHCHSPQKQLLMVTAFLLTSTHHIPIHHHAMKQRLSSWFFFQNKFNMGNVTLFTYLFTCLTSPWRCQEIKYTMWVRFLNRKSNPLFLAVPTNKLSIVSVKDLQYQLGLCQYLWKSREQQTKQSTEVSDNEIGLFEVQGVPTIVMEMSNHLLLQISFGHLNRLHRYTCRINDAHVLCDILKITTWINTHKQQ